ncbi:ROK family protein [Salinibacterium sp. SYSU T00001]|uniref:ROK family protein n=1 Tax=Homoserinimonas sedimenticola TaxID=2986805 RepID=UPI002235CE5F|nr:ROK family protein [Salinibacterium sedimenticola]MCW4386719.1 ROK family protein [Salinibacterium sedimenticola]
MPLALAVDFGGTKVEAALIDEDGRMLAGSRHRQATGARAEASVLESAVEHVTAGALAALPPTANLAGVGIGSAGPIDRDAGRVSPLNVPAWRGHPLREQLEAAVPGVPVRLEIDGLCIALAENWTGATRGCGTSMGMIVSTGVGGGLIVDGRPVHGTTGNAGHIGHVEVAGFEDPCACGGIGCLEAIASGPKTVAWARRQGWSGDTGEDLAAAHASGNEVAQAAVARSGTALGRAIASATALCDLEAVAIGGGFSRVAPELFDHIRAAIRERTSWEFVRKVRVLPSGLSDEGPLVGAAALIHRP